MSNDTEITVQFRTTKIIYISLFSFILFSFIIVIILMQGRELEASKELDKIFMVIVPIFGLMTMLATRMLYYKLIANYSSGKDLLQKLVRYRTAKIISWAIVESACFLALVASILTSNYVYVVVVLFLLGYYFMLKPSRESFIRDMRLNSEESKLILKSQL